MNFKIFPATLNSEGQKVPLIKGWKDAASNDPAQIQLWSELFRDRLKFWGIPCGQINGIFAIDIDVKPGKVNGWESLKNLSAQLPHTLRQDTPSGGSHFFFRAQPGIHYPNTVNQKIGIDTRGDGGWVAYYGFVNDLPLADVPDWVVRLSPRVSDATQTYSNPNSAVKVSPEIANNIINQSLEAIRNAPEGESNNVLNTESFRVGQLVMSGSVSRAYAESALFKAAKERGKPDYEARATIASGLNGGLAKPLTSPFGENQPQPSIDIPPMPEKPGRWTPEYFTKYDLLNTAKLRKPQLFTDWSTEDIAITTADGGTGKTTLKLYEAICLALGERFLGFECKQPGKTLFITGEDTDKKLAAMLGAIIRQMGLFEEGLRNHEKIQTILSSIVVKKDADLCLISKDKQHFLHPNQDSMQKILQAVDDIKPKMIVFDPISSFWGSENAVNDMAKAVTKFMSELVDRSKACVEMINHMGKQSSANKDMSQFAGRGGTGLPSNARVSRVLRQVFEEEYAELTGEVLEEHESALLCNVNKFSDGSPLYNKPFLILRNGYLFTRKATTKASAQDFEKSMPDTERIFTFIKEERRLNKYPTKDIIIGNFMLGTEILSRARVEAALKMLAYSGHMGEKIKLIENPDASVRDRAYVVIDMEGKEV